MKETRRALGYRTLYLLLVGLACWQFALGQVDPRMQGSPKVLVITYKCRPVQRIRLRNYMTSNGLAQIENFKTMGILTGYRVLFSRYVDSDNWDMMLIVSLSDGAALNGWREVEMHLPAGLSEQALETVVSVSTTPADLTRSDALPDARPHPVFLVIPYDYTVSTPEYARYLDGYVIPQLEGWHERKILSHYEIFIARYGAARPWSALLLLQYADEGALGARDRVSQSVREKLSANPSWKTFADNKDTVRAEKQAVVSDELASSEKP
jgi:hypothetical protein